MYSALWWFFWDWPVGATLPDVILATAVPVIGSRTASPAVSVRDAVSLMPERATEKA
jgi:hypothetical protein